MQIRLSNELNNILLFAQEEAARLGNYNITTDHLILAIIRHSDNNAAKALEILNINLSALKRDIESHFMQQDALNFEQTNNITFSKAAEDALKATALEANFIKAPLPYAEHLMLAILRRGYWSYAVDFLKNKEVNYVTFKTALGMISESNASQRAEAEYGNDNHEEELYDSSSQPPQSRPHTGSGGKNQSVLDNYGHDLTLAAKNGKLDPVVGREKEIERLAQILGRRKKNNPVLIGEPGAGKSAIAEGLAIRIANKEVSRSLSNKRIISIDVGSIVAGTKYRGQFEQRMKSLLKELSENPDIILFIDEIHTLVGAGGAAGSLDAANMLKPALARGEIQCIGATTIDEYREIIEKDGALERRFQKIMVEPTNHEQTLTILETLKEHYQKFHNVVYTDEALRLCVSLSERYITDRCLPDKAIDIMDEAGSRVHLKSLKNNKTPKNILETEAILEYIRQRKEAAVKSQNFADAAYYKDFEKAQAEQLEKLTKRWEARIAKKPDTVDKEDIAEAVSMATSIPIHKIAESESNKLLNMRAELEREIIGQNEAIERVTRAILRNRAGLKESDKPIGTFLFLGPTGVGKTHLAKKLANYMFDSPDSLIRIDMSEYMEKHSLSRLIGAPPGYIGYNEGGQLSEQVRRKPYSVVLLDEIEKAHPDLFNILLQILDEGRLTDSNGRRVDFRNTIIILTSNIGSRELKEYGKGLGYSKVSDSPEYQKSIIDKAINKTFSPELLNRLDEQILFNSLTKSNIEKIIEIELKNLYTRVKEAGFILKLTPGAKKFVAEMGFDSRFGARPLKRAIRRYIEDPVAEAVISNKYTEGQTITIELNGEKDDTFVK